MLASQVELYAQVGLQCATAIPEARLVAFAHLLVAFLASDPKTLYTAVDPLYVLDTMLVPEAFVTFYIYASNSSDAVQEFAHSPRLNVFVEGSHVEGTENCRERGLVEGGAHTRVRINLTDGLGVLHDLTKSSPICGPIC
jgi:hypothetical protein